MGTEWFRNTEWDEDIERAFEQKLRRARKKDQYLRIQACTLARTHPEVALKLLDRYFETDDVFDRAQAHVDRATALLALGRVEEALDSYEAALARERAFPRMITQARLAFPFVVALREIQHRYERARDILSCAESGLMFPVDHFRWHAAHALIASASGQAESARDHAARALDAVRTDHSGLRYHPTVGLVTSEYDEVVRMLEALGGAGFISRGARHVRTLFQRVWKARTGER